MNYKKSDIRRCSKSARNNLTAEERNEKSQIITDNLISTEVYKQNSNILIYISANNEVDTTGIFYKALSDGKNVYCPKVYGKNMDFIQINSYDELTKGSFGIFEPVSDNISYIEEGLIIMPGVAFDRYRNRLGYGGGFYDRYMAKHKQLASCAICFECQIVDTIPSETHDIKPDMLITEEKTY
ncbi:MAG: 5-formyltetrahydrofolate cyclo-ligase [Coprococcus sp.]